ncbi:hypothetical protein AVEN_257778-1 [Araneus ventricosus]|uniref:Uncharacterized protein n=1 Tax=Araneus ventricosus TaxID=182803 RepID=A0A4Y2KBR5_ARAVE|nr:hypothetical protein AVEN_257778-1 [Araneus ventricosus]
MYRVEILSYRTDTTWINRKTDLVQILSQINTFGVTVKRVTPSLPWHSGPLMSFAAITRVLRPESSYSGLSRPNSLSPGHGPPRPDLSQRRYVLSLEGDNPTPHYYTLRGSENPLTYPAASHPFTRGAPRRRHFWCNDYLKKFISSTFCVFGLSLSYTQE